jgi:hypothetical protein
MTILRAGQTWEFEDRRLMVIGTNGNGRTRTWSLATHEPGFVDVEAARLVAEGVLLTDVVEVRTVEYVPGPRVLTEEEVKFCAALGMDVGYDVDDDLPQDTHICWPHILWWGALCRTERLWGSGAGIDKKITCDECLRRLPSLMRRDPELLDGVGRLNAASLSLSSVYFAAAEFLWSLDRPEEYARAQADRPSLEARTELNDAIRHERERWKAVVEAGKPGGGTR